MMTIMIMMMMIIIIRTRTIGVMHMQYVTRVELSTLLNQEVCFKFIIGSKT